MSDQNSTASTETAPRRRGRPANFPGRDTKARLYHLPLETIEMVEAEAARKSEPIGVALDRLIAKAFKDLNRKRG